MTLNLTMPGQEDLKPRITVFGVGGAGGNAVNNMIEKELDGVDFVVANTDAQALQQSNAQNRIQLGVKVTEGLGAGARASVGAAAAEESIETPIGTLRALPVKQLPKQGLESIQIWLAADYRYLPVLIRHFDREGKFSGEQVVSEIRISEE
mgnify:CR=1 FL=1